MPQWNPTAVNSENSISQKKHTCAIATHFLIEIPSTVFSTAFALKDDSDESEETEDFVGVFLVVL